MESNGKVVVVTGASGGIGAATASGLAGLGFIGLAPFGVSDDGAALKKSAA